MCQFLQSKNKTKHNFAPRHRHNEAATTTSWKEGRRGCLEKGVGPGNIDPNLLGPDILTCT